MYKAFDMASWKYLRVALAALNFGPDFTSFINMMYDEDAPPTRQVRVGGQRSRSFEVLSGVAQGDPLSPLLFMIVRGKPSPDT